MDDPSGMRALKAVRVYQSVPWGLAWADSYRDFEFQWSVAGWLLSTAKSGKA